MTDRDPLGREQGEDPLAGLGWRGPAEPAPAAAEPPVAPVRRGRSLSGLHITIAVVALLVGGLAIVGVLLMMVAVGGRLGGSFDEATPVAPVAPRGMEGASLLRTENLRRALVPMRGDGRVQSVKLSPANLEVRFVNSRHRVVWNVPAHGDARRASFAPYDDHNTTIRFAEIDPAAPARLARTAARRAQRDVRDIQALFLLLQLGRPRWVLTFDGGLRYTADRHGRHVEPG
jgi:hypothetical protein